jgi:oligoribonuclease
MLSTSKSFQHKINRVLRKSVEYAFANPKSGLDFIRQHAQEMSEEVIYKHIDLYVNKYAVELGVEGRKAINLLFDTAVEKKIMAQPPSSAASGPNESWLIWVDMEMTGLRPDIDRIIEVALVVTDSQLNILAESEAIAVHQPDDVLAGMDQWNQSTHGRSGLTRRVQESRITEVEAQRRLIEFLRPWVPAGKSPMCGNSIGQDRRFMARYMPELEAWFHYRNLDVSTLKELCKRWRPEVARGFNKRSAHTALADIHESIDELIYYREHFIGLANAPTA